jgi:hypothetical protein
MSALHPIMQAALAPLTEPALRTVHFKNVGRLKESWTAKLPNAAETTIAHEAKRALLSRDIEADYEAEDEHKGVILVGGWRIAGYFEVEPLPVPA